MANFPDLLTEPAFELLGGGTKRQIGPCADQIDHRLSLCQVHFPVEKCALGKFTRPGRPRAAAQTRFKDFRRYQSSAVATDLEQIFAGVTGRRAMDREHHLVDQPAFAIDDLAEMLNMRSESRRIFFAAKNLLGTVADIYHHEIRDAGHKPDLHLGKLFLEISAAFIDVTFRLALMRIIVQSRERASVGDTVHIKWLSGLLKHFDQVGPRDAVPDPQTSESVNFGKGAQDDDVPT